MERGLRLLGLIGISDPPRASAAAIIAACQAAGITPVLITGDHPATARAIAAGLGIIGADEPVIDCRAGPGGEAEGRPGCSPGRPRSRSSPSSPAARPSATWSR